MKRKTNDNLVITITLIETNMLLILKYDLMISIKYLIKYSFVMYCRKK